MKARPTAYLLTLAAIVVAGLLLVGAWNHRVDPYDLYGSGKKQGWNHFHHLASGPMQRMSLAHRIRRIKPDGLILGTSRVGWAIDPDHPKLGEITPLFLNAGLNGGTIYEAWRYFQHAHHIRPQKAVVIGLDIEMFNSPRIVREEGIEVRLAVDSSGRPNPRHRHADRVSTLFSMDALEASRQTIKQSKKHRELSREYIMQRGGEFQESQIGPDKIFDQFNARWKEGQHNLSILNKQSPRIVDRMLYLEKLLDLAYREDMRVFLFITPYHYTLQDIIKDSGSGKTFAFWKRRMVDINEAQAARHGRSAAPIWDFSGYNRITRDPPPSPEEPRRLMTWYMECSHYKKSVGDLVIERMFQTCDTPADFGQCLDPDGEAQP